MVAHKVHVDGFFHALYSHSQLSGSHGYFGTINRTQVLIIKAPPDTPPHRIGSSVGLVSKICEEESTSERTATFNSLSKQDKDQLAANQSSLC